MPFRLNKQLGFTLIELLIAMALSGIVIAAIYSLYLSQAKSYVIQDQVAEMQQNARVAMEMMIRDIRMAGFGAPKSNISSWIDWVTGVTIDTNPKIVQGSGSAPDTIYIVGCFDSPLASLSTSALSGATSLSLQSATEASKFNTTSKKVICVGGAENALITAISGSTLTIDTDPTSANNQGLTGDYGVGTSIYLVKAITYSIVSNTLKRNENTGAGRQPLAENIENLQISQSGDSINISLTARTDKPDPDYTNNSGYRQRRLTSRVIMRNLQ